MLARLQGQHSVIPQSRRPSPHHNITMRHRNAKRPVRTLHPAKYENRRNSQRDGNNRLAKVSFILVLMKGQPRSRLVAIDQTCIRKKTGKACLLGGILRKLQKGIRHRRPVSAALRVDRVIAISCSIRYPSQRPAVRHSNRHAKAAWSDHLAKRSYRNYILQPLQKRSLSG